MRRRRARQPRRHQVRRSAAARVRHARRDRRADADRRRARGRVARARLDRRAGEPRARRRSPLLVRLRMKHTITLIPGDGIGPEVTEAVIRIVNASGVSIEWEQHDAGVVAVERTGQTLPIALIDSIRRNKVALKGPVTTPIGEGFTSVNVGLRKALDLYANLRPVWNLPGVDARFEAVDLVIVRENTEDLYAGLEHQVVPGVVESLKIITERAS